MIRQLFKYMALTLTLLALAACGGGGGGEGGGPTVTVKISLSGTLPANTAIAGAGFTLTLPADVTPATMGGVIATGVITPSGTFSNGTQAPPIYTPAAAPNPGSIVIALASANPAGVTQVGEVATLTLQLANGAAPVAASFVLAAGSVNVIDTFGNPINGMAAVISGVQLQ